MDFEEMYRGIMKKRWSKPKWKISMMMLKEWRWFGLGFEVDGSFYPEWHIEINLGLFSIWFEYAQWLEPYQELKHSDYSVLGLKER